MGRKTERTFRFKHFMIVLLSGIVLGAVFILLFPQYLVKKPPEGAFLKTVFSEEGLPDAFSIILWNGFHPSPASGKQGFPPFPDSLLLFAETALPELLVFSSVPLADEASSNDLPERPRLPEEFDRRFPKFGLYAIKNESKKDAVVTLHPYHLLWSRAKPDVVPNNSAPVSLGLFPTKESLFPFTVFEYSREQGKLRLYLTDFSSVRDATEWDTCLTVLKEEILAQYAQGKSVLVAGDWFTCLPGVQNCSATANQIPILWTPEGWNWFYPIYPEVSPFASVPFRDAFTGILASPDLLARDFETFTPQASPAGNETVSYNSAIRVIFTEGR
ncbi:MAG: hypothetical protein PHX90_04820 [Thermotogota bacterium]|nr:hypothetical protein [Thermotogota bacterium]